MKGFDWKDLQKLHMDPLSTQRVKIELIFALRTAVYETWADFVGIKPGIWKKVPDVAYGPSFYPRGLKLSSFSLYGQRCSKCGLIFKIAIFGHKICNLKKKAPEVKEVAYGPYFYPWGVEIELIIAIRAAVSEIRADFQNCHIWTWNLEFEKSAESCIWTIFLP